MKKDELRKEFSRILQDFQDEVNSWGFDESTSAATQEDILNLAKQAYYLASKMGEIVVSALED